METKQATNNHTRLRIAVNTRLLLNGKLEGIGVFTQEIFVRMAKDNPEIDFVFIFDRPFAAHFIEAPNVTSVVLFPPTRHPILWYYWFEFAIPKLLQKLKASVFISPDGMIPLRCKVPSISVIHDLNFVEYPQYVPKLTGWFYNYFYPKYARAASHIVTVSDYSKTDICVKYQIAPEKISVVYNAASISFKPLTEVAKSETKNQYTAGTPYFIYVGAFNPRKNLQKLLQAFALFKQTDKQAYKLLLVGAPMFKNQTTLAYYNAMRFRESVIFTGRVSATDLPNLVASARALVLISVYEGFGIPLVEAMQCNVPVICSNATALPEIAGNAGIIVEPTNFTEVADALSLLSVDNKAHKKLVENSKQILRRFSWDESAKKMTQIALNTIRK